MRFRALFADEQPLAVTIVIGWNAKGFNQAPTTTTVATTSAGRANHSPSGRTTHQTLSESELKYASKQTIKEIEKHMKTTRSLTNENYRCEPPTNQPCNRPRSQANKTANGQAKSRNRPTKQVTRWTKFTNTSAAQTISQQTTSNNPLNKQRQATLWIDLNQQSK